MNAPIQELPLEQVNPFRQTLDAIQSLLQRHGNLKKLVKDLNIITFNRKMNAGLRKNIAMNKGASPSLIVSPSDIDVTQILGAGNCDGKIIMGYDFTLFDKGNNVTDILELVWQLFQAINSFGNDMGLSFIEQFQWQIGAIGQANELGFLEQETEGWSSFLPIIVVYTIDRKILNINTQK